MRFQSSIQLSRTVKWCALLVLGLVGSSANVWSHTGNLRGLNSFEGASLLPQGIFKAEFKTIGSQTSENWNGAGAAAPLSQGLKQTIRWQTVTNGGTSIQNAQLNSVLRGLRLQGVNQVGSNDIAGFTDGDVNVGAAVFVPHLGFGVSKKLNVGISVPIYRVDVSAGTSFRQGASTQAVIDAVRASNPIAAQQLANQLNNAVNTQLTGLGYDPISSQTVSHVGDVNVGVKYLLHSSAKNKVVLKPVVTFPTGKAPDANKALDIATGDGQWDVSAIAIWGHSLTTKTALTAFGGYTWQVADRIDKRIPTQASSLSADVENVKRDLGDLVQAGASVSHAFTQAISLEGGYSFKFMDQARFRGSEFSSDRYLLLDQTRPSQTLHSASILAGFSTVAMFRRGGFPMPMRANIMYSRALAGRNVPKSDVVSADISVYF